MVRSSQFLALVLAVLFVTAVAAHEVVDEAPSITEQAEATKEAATEKTGATTQSAKMHLGTASETSMEEAIPIIKEKIEATKEASMKEAAELGETVNSWRNWAMKRSREWTGQGRVAAGEATESAKAYATKGAESFHSSSAEAQDAAKGSFNKWSNWAKKTAGKYRPKKNPAAEAAAYINKHTTGATEKEDL
ncbi:unnamed protein product [Calypogeia fissa]